MFCVYTEVMAQDDTVTVSPAMVMTGGHFIVHVRWGKLFHQFLLVNYFLGTFA